MARPPYRALRILLAVFSFLAAVGGLFMIFAGKDLVSAIFLAPAEAQISTLLLSLLKEVGGLTLTMSLLLWFASRDPVRNVAIINALIIGLCILAITPLISLWTTDISKVYPSYMIWGRSVVRLVIAALLFWLRPRERRWEPVGNF